MSGVDPSAMAFRGLRAFDDRASVTCHERRLMLAVILNAAYDAVGRGVAAYPRERDKARREALAWFRNGGDDFEAVCDLAGLDPRSTRLAVLRFVASGRELPSMRRGYAGGARFEGQQRRAA